MEEEDVGQVRELLEELALRPLDDDVALEDDHPVSPASCGVYVLELAGGKLYVGSSADWDSRIEQHKAASGATAWTAVHRFLSVKSKLPLAPVLPRTELDKVLRRKELDVFADMVFKHGLNNVRGSFCTTVKLSHDDRKMVHRVVCELKGLCRSCGRRGHCMSTCPPRGQAAWMQAAVLAPPLPPAPYDHTHPSTGPLPPGCSNRTSAKWEKTCAMCGDAIVPGHCIVKLDDTRNGMFPSSWIHSCCTSTLYLWRRRAEGLDDAGPGTPDAQPFAPVPGLVPSSPAYQSPSEEQLGLYTWFISGTGHAVVDAKAGAAKTSSLLAALSLVCRSSETPLVLAFNTHNKLELRKQRGPLKIDVNTFNSAGLEVWSSFRRQKDKADKKKATQLIKALLPPQRGPGGAAQPHPDMRLKSFVKKAVSLAKCTGLGISADETVADWQRLAQKYHGSLSRLLKAAMPEDSRGADTLAVAHARGLQLAAQVLDLSRQACYRPAGGFSTVKMDFDDQVYMPLWHEQRNPGQLAWLPRKWLCIDEGQDMNAARTMLMHKLLAPDGRCVVVGDPFQSIYGFTGTTSDSLGKLQSELQALRLPLSVCWRCPVSHLAVAQTLCFGNGMTAPIRPKPAAEAGILKKGGATLASATVPLSQGVILCRYNAPLVLLYREMVRRGWRARLLSKGELGDALRARLAKALKGLDCAGVHNAEHLERLLREHADRVSKKPVNKTDAVDEVECLLTLLRDADLQLRGAALVDKVQRLIETNYPKIGDDASEQSGVLTLSTIHKAKGKEWPLVFLLQPASLFGLREALEGRTRTVDDDDEAEERNCTYVAVTRSTKELIVLKHIAKEGDAPLDFAPLLDGCAKPGDDAVEEDRNVRRRSL